MIPIRMSGRVLRALLYLAAFALFVDATNFDLFWPGAALAQTAIPTSVPLQNGSAITPATVALAWPNPSTGNGQAVSATNPLPVGGNVASGTADSGNGVKISGVYNSTITGVASGQRADLATTPSGLPMMTICDFNSVSLALCDRVSVPNDSFSLATNALPTWSITALVNASTFERARSILGSVAAGTGDAAVAIAPHSVAAGAIVPTVTSTASGSLQLKASAGNLYRVAITPTLAGYLMGFNQVSGTPPADGTVTPQLCRSVAANTTTVVDLTHVPQRYSLGILMVFSTTGCFTKTISNTAMIEGEAV